MRTLLALLLLAVTTVPVVGQAHPHSHVDQIYREFKAGYAVLDVERVASLYGEEALYVSSRSAPLIGRAAIAGSFKEFFDAVGGAGATLQIRFRIVERRVTDDAVWDLGYYHLARVTAGQVGNPSVGRFVTGVRREADGHWRFVVDTFEGSDLAAWDAAERGIEP